MKKIISLVTFIITAANSLKVLKKIEKIYLERYTSKVLDLSEYFDMHDTENITLSQNRNVFYKEPFREADPGSPYHTIQNCKNVEKVENLRNLIVIACEKKIIFRSMRYFRNVVLKNIFEFDISELDSNYQKFINFKIGESGVYFLTRNENYNGKLKLIYIKTEEILRIRGDSDPLKISKSVEIPYFKKIENFNNTYLKIIQVKKGNILSPVVLILQKGPLPFEKNLHLYESFIMINEEFKSKNFSDFKREKIIEVYNGVFNLEHKKTSTNLVLLGTVKKLYTERHTFKFSKFLSCNLNSSLEIKCNLQKTMTNLKINDSYFESWNKDLLYHAQLIEAVDRKKRRIFLTIYDVYALFLNDKSKGSILLTNQSKFSFWKNIPTDNLDSRWIYHVEGYENKYNVVLKLEYEIQGLYSVFKIFNKKTGTSKIIRSSSRDFSTMRLVGDKSVLFEKNIYRIFRNGHPLLKIMMNYPELLKFTLSLRGILRDSDFSRRVSSEFTIKIHQLEFPEKSKILSYSDSEKPAVLNLFNKINYEIGIPTGLYIGSDLSFRPKNPNSKIKFTDLSIIEPEFEFDFEKKIKGNWMLKESLSDRGYHAREYEISDSGEDKTILVIFDKCQDITKNHERILNPIYRCKELSRLEYKDKRMNLKKFKIFNEIFAVIFEDPAFKIIYFCSFTPPLYVSNTVIEIDRGNIKQFILLNKIGSEISFIYTKENKPNKKNFNLVNIDLNNYEIKPFEKKELNFSKFLIKEDHFNPIHFVRNILENDELMIVNKNPNNILTLFPINLNTLKSTTSVSLYSKYEEHAKFNLSPCILQEKVFQAGLDSGGIFYLVSHKLTNSFSSSSFISSRIPRFNKPEDYFIRQFCFPEINTYLLHVSIEKENFNEILVMKPAKVLHNELFKEIDIKYDCEKQGVKVSIYGDTRVIMTCRDVKTGKTRFKIIEVEKKKSLIRSTFNSTDIENTEIVLENSYTKREEKFTFKCENLGGFSNHTGVDQKHFQNNKSKNFFLNFKLDSPLFEVKIEEKEKKKKIMKIRQGMKVYKILQKNLVVSENLEKIQIFGDLVVGFSINRHKVLTKVVFFKKGYMKQTSKKVDLEGVICHKMSASLDLNRKLLFVNLICHQNYRDVLNFLLIDTEKTKENLILRKVYPNKNYAKIDSFFGTNPNEFFLVAKDDFRSKIEITKFEKIFEGGISQIIGISIGRVHNVKSYTVIKLLQVILLIFKPEHDPTALHSCKLSLQTGKFHFKNSKLFVQNIALKEKKFIDQFGCKPKNSKIFSCLIDYKDSKMRYLEMEYNEIYDIISVNYLKSFWIYKANDYKVHKIRFFRKRSADDSFLIHFSRKIDFGENYEHLIAYYSLKTFNDSPHLHQLGIFNYSNVLKEKKTELFDIEFQIYRDYPKSFAVVLKDTAAVEDDIIYILEPIGPFVEFVSKNLDDYKTTFILLSDSSGKIHNISAFEFFGLKDIETKTIEVLEVRYFNCVFFFGITIIVTTMAALVDFKKRKKSIRNYEKELARINSDVLSERSDKAVRLFSTDESRFTLLSEAEQSNEIVL